MADKGRNEVRETWCMEHRQLVRRGLWLENKHELPLSGPGLEILKRFVYLKIRK